ncbi:MAG: DinB family protein [Acidobacteriaceae bacterium]
MKETPQEYTKRIVSQTEGQKPLEVQAATASKLQGLLEGVPPSKLEHRPAADKWSAREIVAHMADAEIAGSFRIRMILSAPGTPIMAFDQDSWVTSGHYEKRDTQKSLELFRVLREANLTLLASLTPEQWQHHGMHSERGKETIEHITRMFAGHDLNHIQQLDRILGGKG